MPEEPKDHPTNEGRHAVTRREALALLGAAGVAVAAAACGSPATTAASATNGGTTGSSAGAAAGSDSATSPATCVLSPEMTEGPYYIDGEAVRSDVTEGKPGTPLRLDLTVVDASRCTPIPSASVEIWHADAVGNYSGFNATAENTTFLRGVQVSDAAGAVTFRTIYPGWYQGRATHIHLKVHVGGSVVHTGQLFFDEAINDAVYATTAYRTHTGQRMTNDQDGIYANGGAASTLTLARSGDGYRGAILLGVQTG